MPAVEMSLMIYLLCFVYPEKCWIIFKEYNVLDGFGFDLF